MASTSSTTRGQQAKKRSAAQLSAPHDSRDVRTKLQDFTKAMEELVAEAEDARDERTMLKQNLTEAHVRNHNAAEEARVVKEKYEEQLRVQVDDCCCISETDDTNSP